MDAAFTKKVDALEELREALKGFRPEELVWDAGCNNPPYIRAAIMAEFKRRGLSYDEAVRKYGRGQRRGGMPF